MKLLLKVGVLALLTVSSAANKALRAAEAAEEKTFGPKKILEVDVSIDHGQLIVDYEADRCTSIIVGAKAGIEGPMTTHTADCLNCNFRLGKVSTPTDQPPSQHKIPQYCKSLSLQVPAQDWPEGTMRPLYVYHGAYPSVVSANRGATWHPDNLEGSPEQIAAWGKESTITGYIPQVGYNAFVLKYLLDTRIWYSGVSNRSSVTHISHSQLTKHR